MTEALEPALRTLFTDARTHFAWRDRPVADELLVRLYDVLKMAPTGANGQSARIVFAKSHAAKEKLRDIVDPTNLEKTLTAPVTAVLGYDPQFYELFPKLFPQRPEMRDRVAGLPEAVREMLATTNATLQAGYLILAARALGLDAGPMGGFDRAKADAAFFADGKAKSLLLVNLGYGDASKLFPRLPRLEFAEACRIE